MPTPDPSLVPALITSVASVFTTNWTTFLTATIALIAIVVIPSTLARGGLHLAVKSLRKVFGGAK